MGKKILLTLSLFSIVFAQPQNQNNQSDPKTDLSLKFLLPPEELQIVQQKKALEEQQLQLRLMKAKLEQAKLKAQLEATQALMRIKTETYQSLQKIIEAKLRELQTADLQVEGVVGNVVITPKLAIQNGTEVGRGLKLIVENEKRVIVRDSKGNYLVVPLASNPENLVQNVSASLQKVNNLPQTFQLLSGEKFKK